MEQTVEHIGAWSATLGILMIILGLFAILGAVTTTFVSLFFIGGILVVRGLFQGIYAFVSLRREHFWHNLFGGILSLLVGLLVLARPAMTAAVLVLLVILYLIGTGLFRTIAAPVQHGRGWPWEMVAGILSLVLGILLLAGWPAISLWAIGLFIGIEILMLGVVMTALPRAVRSATEGENAAWAGR
jgi:uncharacterized membrane protein HdeD (DUF308 family)